MFSSKKALSWKTFPDLVWLGADTAEARGRTVTLSRNDLAAPGTAAGNAPCFSVYRIGRVDDRDLIDQVRPV